MITVCNAVIYILSTRSLQKTSAKMCIYIKSLHVIESDSEAEPPATTWRHMQSLFDAFCVGIQHPAPSLRTACCPRSTLSALWRAGAPLLANIRAAAKKYTGTLIDCFDCKQRILDYTVPVLECTTNSHWIWYNYFNTNRFLIVFFYEIYKLNIWTRYEF